ncbi:MAG: C4-type zinc ribbon domain-containing protein [Candidatus Neomarinimicrobiota bacterium]|nr:C4-type zinc ribbon domain-containing protein [Candidatus Neomarinimicrobiota bacterium]MDD3966349.1 C4-type zinc ribbon domain-containing protein [Candidatus Neomarinimicrobiota bacterium]MDX9780400.1 C4-type zinc ribbon domain-containing protein [bacterium]
MQKVLQQLIELQELDTRRDVLIARLGDLPETVKTLEKQIGNEKEQNIIRQTGIEENESLIQSNKAKIEDLKEKIVRYKEQLYLVTTNREYDALTAEIEFNEEAVRTAEGQILQAGEENDRLREALERSEKNVQDMDAHLVEVRNSLEETQKQTEEEKAVIEAKRSELSAAIPRNFISMYTRVRNARNGLAVVALVRDACSGCHNRVIPQKRVNIYKRNQVITCDYCGRFLYASLEKEEE